MTRTAFALQKSFLRTSVGCVLAITGALFCGLSTAQERFPTGPVRMVIPSAAGGPTDIAGRVIAQKLSELWGQPVIPDNQASVNGLIAASSVAKAKADGYTLLVGNSGTHVMNVGLYRNLSYDPVKDFVPIAKTVVTPLLLITNASLPVTDVQSLITYAKANPTFVASLGATGQVAALMFNSMTGVNMTLVPFRGGGGAGDLSVAQNETQASFTSLLSARPHMSSGRVRAIAVTSAKPLPGIPSLSDTVKGYELEYWTGLFAPAGTPKAIVDKISQDLGRVMRDPTTLKRLDDAGFTPAYESSDAFANLVKTSSVKYKELMGTLGIKPE